MIISIYFPARILLTTSQLSQKLKKEIYMIFIDADLQWVTFLPTNLGTRKSVKQEAPLYV